MSKNSQNQQDIQLVSLWLFRSENDKYTLRQMIEQLGEKEAEVWRNKTLEECLDDENDFECSFGEHAISAVVSIII